MKSDLSGRNESLSKFVKLCDREFKQTLINSINMGQKVFAFLFLLLCICSVTCAQTAEYNQFTSEIQFARAINDKWSGELDLLGTFSSTPTESRPLKTNIQRAVSIYGHYYYSSRWKF